MIKTSIYFGCYLLITLIQGHKSLGDYRCAERLSPTALQEDFSFFRQRLEKYHPGLYTYATKSEIDSAFAAIEAQLDHGMSELEFYRLLSPLKSLIKDGHTYFYPSEQTQSSLSRSWPLITYWDGKSLWVRGVFLSDLGVSAGNEILTINGHDTREIVNHLMSNIIRDGKNKTYPRWILNQWFWQIYSYHFETPEQWELEFIDNEGQNRKITLQELSPNSKTKQVENLKGIELQYEGEVAWLKVASFNSSLLKSRFHQRFRPEIKEAFERIKQNQTEGLILDLRDNQGGDINNGRYLLSYLLEERFALVQALKKVVEPDASLDESRLGDKSIAKLGWTEPQKNRFAGKLVVLMNGGSFSCSGAVLAQLEAAERGIIIGEEAAGNRRIFCGVGPSETLPHSKISLAVPRVQFQVVENSHNFGMGVIPDHPIVPSITDLIEGRDIELEIALSLF